MLAATGEFDAKYLIKPLKIYQNLHGTSKMNMSNLQKILMKFQNLLKQEMLLNSDGVELKKLEKKLKKKPDMTYQVSKKKLTKVNAQQVIMMLNTWH